MECINGLCVFKEEEKAVVDNGDQPLEIVDLEVAVPPQGEEEVLEVAKYCLRL